MNDYFTYTINISKKSEIISNDEYFSKFDDADYIQVNSGKFASLIDCQEKATRLLKHLTLRENKSTASAVVMQINPRFGFNKGQRKEVSGWQANTVLKLLTVDAEELKKEKKLTYTLSGLIESSRPLSPEEFEVYFSKK